MNEQSIFTEALERTDPQERAAFLTQACQGDPTLRQRIERLLCQHEHAGTFLEQPPAPVALDNCFTLDQPHERPGTDIGPYKLIEQIGEGGMGTVWMAQQQRPVKRLVALKVIKPGMDSRLVIARFEAERQALALMDHPHIARVLDGGATSAGRPYFVMDLVRGTPITQYCDEHHLTPRQRLELFVPVCQAVQHAHQKGIIHRDLKPSNVLVALYDGRPVPKVIDFGVAKAAGQSLTEQTLVTGFGNIVGTFEYMSPEQAEFNQLDIDTRSDIYSLGVLLYELLTGSPPFTRKELEKAGMLEMLRVIREQEPSKPSTKLSTAEGLPTLAANRGTEPAKLAKLVRGELDWIVMKALEKDRNRRYETATGFAMDVQRYLADEAVLACPPSVAYRLRKLIRRNKRSVIAMSVILLCLIAGIIGTTWGMIRAEYHRQVAETRETETKHARDQAMTALRALTDDIVENQIARGAVLTDENKEFLRKIITHFEGFAALTADDAESRAIRAEGYYRVGRMQYFLGDMKESEVALADALAIYTQLAVEFPGRPELRRELAKCYHILGSLFFKTDRLNESEAGYTDALAIQKPLVADFPTRPEFRQELARSHNSLGILLATTGRLKQAETAYADALVIQKKLAEEFPTRPEFRLELASSYMNLGILYSNTNRPKESEASYRESLAIQKKLADDFPTRPEYRRYLASSHNNLGVLFINTGRVKEAETTYADALAIRKQLAADFPTRPEFRQDLATSLNNLGNLLCEVTGRVGDAEKAYTDALAIQKPLVSDFPNQRLFREDLARSQNNLGHLLRRLGRPKEAETAYADALAIRKQLAADFPNLIDYRIWLADTLSNLAELCNQRGDFNSGKAHQEEVVAAFLKAIELDPKDARLRNDLGVRLYKNGNLSEAIEAYRAAIELDPNDAGTYANLGLALRDQGMLDDAIAACRQAINLNPKHANAHHNLGLCLSDQSKFDDAVASYLKAIDIDPKHVNAHYNLGNNYYAERKTDEAIIWFRKAIELAPNFAPAHANLGSALLRLGKPEAAAACCKKALEINPNDLAARHNLGRIFRDEGKYEEAIAQYRDVLRFKVDDVRALNELAYLLAARREAQFHDPNQAAELAQRAVDLEPEDYRSWLALGVAHYRAGKWDEALAALEKSCRFEKATNGQGNAWQWLWMAMAHWQMGRQDEARSWYQKAIELETVWPEELRRVRTETEEVLELEKQ